MNIQSSINTDIGLSRDSSALMALKQSLEQARQAGQMVAQQQQTTQSTSPSADGSRGTLLDILV